MATVHRMLTTWEQKLQTVHFITVITWANCLISKSDEVERREKRAQHIYVGPPQVSLAPVSWRLGRPFTAWAFGLTNIDANTSAKFCILPEWQSTSRTPDDPSLDFFFLIFLPCYNVVMVRLISRQDRE